MQIDYTALANQVRSGKAPMPVVSSAPSPRLTTSTTIDYDQLAEQVRQSKAPVKPASSPISNSTSTPPQPSLTDRVLSLLPSPRTAARVSGGVVGGLAGPEGILPGVMIGESLYQLGQHAINSPEAPQSSSEAASNMSGAAIDGALQAGIPWLAQYHAEHPILPALRRSLFRSPQTLVTKALNPSDNFFQNHVERGLTELNTGKAKILAADNPVQASRDVLKQRQLGYNAQIQKIVKPQASIVVPGSGEALAKAQVEQIPEDIRIHDPAKYANLVNKATQTANQDLTIGELNKLRSELAATQSVYYGKDMSGQLTLDAGTRAMDIARGNASRRLFYHALDNYGLGGGQAAAEINGRIGSTIHMDDALLPNVNTSVAQKLPLGTKVLRAAGSITSPGKWGMGARTVDQDLTLAIKRWGKLPEPVKVSLEPRIAGIAGAQQDLLPTGQPGSEPLLAPPPGTSKSIGESIFKIQQAANQAARSAPPATISGTARGLNFMPGPLGADRFGPKGEYLTPELEYLQDLGKRQLWSNAAPPTPPPGQLEMFPGGPPTMFPPSENFPSFTPVSSVGSGLQQQGLIGTHGAHLLALTEPIPRPEPPPIPKSASPSASTVIKTLEENGKIGTRGAEAIKTAEEYLRRKGIKK